jgi:cephalosporin hydroxylase
MSDEDDRDEFERAIRRDAADMAADVDLRQLALETTSRADEYNYTYFWKWLGLPIIQTPDDIIGMQEIIWETKPQVIIETGFARGGSAVFYSSLLTLIGDGRVVSVDIDFRRHNREAVENHTMGGRITLVEGSSTAPETLERVRELLPANSRVMVVLDSNHTHQHVIEELRLYAPLVSVGQYLVVSDTGIDHIPRQLHRPREWGPGNSPMSALEEYRRETDRFEDDELMNNKLLITSSRGGYLRCVR